MRNEWIIVKARVDETFDYWFSFFLALCFCKRLIEFYCKDAFLQSVEICS